MIIPDINHLSDKEQALKFAEKFSEIPNQYQQLKTDDILTKKIDQTDIPQFKTVQVWWLLSQIRTNKSSVKGDISPKVYKNLAAHIAEPLTPAFNVSLMQGEYPNIYKYEISTPVPKIYPPEKVLQMRNISGLLNFDKVIQKLILAPGSAHARPSTWPPIDTSRNFLAHMSGGGNCLTVFLINFLAKSENSKHFSFFSKKT